MGQPGAGARAGEVGGGGEVILGVVERAALARVSSEGQARLGDAQTVVDGARGRQQRAGRSARSRRRRGRRRAVAERPAGATGSRRARWGRLGWRGLRAVRCVRAPSARARTRRRRAGRRSAERGAGSRDRRGAGAARRCATRRAPARDRLRPRGGAPGRRRRWPARRGRRPHGRSRRSPEPPPPPDRAGAPARGRRARAGHGSGPRRSGGSARSRAGPRIEARAASTTRRSEPFLGARSPEARSSSTSTSHPCGWSGPSSTQSSRMIAYLPSPHVARVARRLLRPPRAGEGTEQGGRVDWLYQVLIAARAPRGDSDRSRGRSRSAR